jgi:small nuclear ribonucleoprotein (snRNP)-like protein
VYEFVVKTRAFDTSLKGDLEAYDKIMNNPLCSIVEKATEKLSDRMVGGEGEQTMINDKVVMIVTWKEKALI